MLFLRCLAAASALTFTLHAAEEKLRLVRETDALTPEQERAGFHVPPGFEVQLFASEPQINKPINMAFDARGRLWVSSTVEYPYAADKGRWSDPQGTNVKGSRDAIKILEDTNGDGKADKVTDFANELNIPTGVLPWHKPEHKAGCIAWSIPNIWYFADTNGDDIADHREVLFGPLGYEKDTHGMCSSFRLGLDGWVYATHGFNNTSKFTIRRPTEQTEDTEKKKSDSVHSVSSVGTSELELHSGNVFRFKPDGSRVEPWTHGQVNPFGLAWDRFGNLYSADCHSSPIYQLIRGAHYPSFGKPHDGLGFAPVMCQHTHGSTGICGIVYIDGGVWGPGWDDHTFVGNVVTSKVNHDHVTFTGSTPKANEQPDFLTSDDPWFRPVDLQLGPDNALYIADFYNKIIGHYEVPLEHPGRDKERGRIWRVVKKDSKPQRNDFTAMPPKEIANELGNPNLTRRHLALREVKQRGAKDWLPELFRIFKSGDSMVAQGDREPADYRDNDIGDFDYFTVDWAHSDIRTAYSLWGLSYLGERFLVSNVLRNLHTGGSWTEDRGEELNGLVMSHAAQVIGSYDHLHPWEKWNLGIAFDGRGSAIGRAAAQALLQRPDFLRGDPEWPGSVVKMLATLTDDLLSPPGPDNWLTSKLGDVAYVHSLRLLLKDVLSQPGVLEHAESRRWAERVLDKPWFIEVLQAVPTTQASSFLFQRLQKGDRIEPGILAHIARHGDPALLLEAISLTRKATLPLPAPDAANTSTTTGERAGVRGPPNTTQQTTIIQAISEGLAERGTPPPPELLAWAQELATQLLDTTATKAAPAWTTLGNAKWSLQPRKLADDTESTVLQSILKGGGDEESRTGTLKSQTFPAPAKLALWINGHRGFPAAKAHDKNLVRITDAETGRELARAFPPRNDKAQRTELDLTAHTGKPVRLEVIDGDDGKAYAWLGITRIEPAVVSVNDFQSADTTRESLKTLATMLQHSAPAALREKLATYLPPRPAPPPLPVSPEQRKQLDTLIAARVAAFAKAKPDLETGANVFKMNCAACHQIKGEGGLIGPQLDGIGARGPARLCEDILDPNRNVDAHFHVHTLTMKDGSTFAGFLKAELGQIHLLADATGKEHRIAKKDIAKTEVTPISLMPPTFGQTLDEATFIDLLGYLLNEKAGKEP
ncbi:MAG: PVC-type heme-binding CxxCH protein [Prosthecobacter sp.]|uniref:PVC-type heme-binding CxxCH protein n=1 Tax=Prosthecobacter sp. TaxID=1965333 RepID=UPI0038FE923A